MSYTHVSSQDIQEGKLAGVLPELYALQMVVENNSGHVHQTVFDHIVGVLQGFEQIVTFQFATDTEKNQLHALLDQKIYDLPRRELVWAAILLHDISKAETLVIHHDQTTSCPGHEFISAAMVQALAPKLETSKEDARRIAEIVLHHGTIHSLPTIIKAKPEFAKEAVAYAKQALGSVFLEVLLLGFADTYGGHLAKLNPEDFAFREQFYQSVLRDMTSW